MAGYSIRGLNHLGLVVEDIAEAKSFFCDFLGLEIIQDRGELLFLAAGNDILALKTPRMAVAKPEHGGESKHLSKANNGWQSLDHYGFFAASREEVDAFADKLRNHGIQILKGPYDRSDGRSVYFRDPCGNVGEYFFYQK
jgi:catechol 2,3-dioxygenase-like lactoylglutathione lyase family enzyme